MLDDASHHNYYHRRRGTSTPSDRPHSAGSERRRPGSSNIAATTTMRQTQKLAIPDRFSTCSSGGDGVSDEFSKTTSSLASMASNTSRVNALRSLHRSLRKRTTPRKSISTTGTSVVTICNEDEEEEEEQQQRAVVASLRRRDVDLPLAVHQDPATPHGDDDIDDEEDIAILQPEADEPRSPVKRVRRWRRSISSLRMALTRSAAPPPRTTSSSPSSTVAIAAAPASSSLPIHSTSTSSGTSSAASTTSSSSRPSAKLLLRRRSKKAPAAMYSISFYPWKRDPRAYYSHPEAAAEWVPDTASKRCQICLAAFHLTRRRHHCRLCGVLACSDCSLPRTYFPFAHGKSRSQHHLIKDGAPQRTCNKCAGTLKHMAAQSDPRVKQFAADVVVTTDPFAMRDDGDDDVDCIATTALDECSTSWSYVHTSGHNDDEIYVIDSHRPTSKRHNSRNHQQLTRCVSVAQFESQTQADELDEVLRARALSRKNLTPKYYVVNSSWLEQWLQYVHIDAAAATTATSRKQHRATPRNVRRPGRITNYALLNFVSGKLVPKDRLERSRGNDSGGDYRIVSEEVWSVFVRLYGGGPCIELRSSSSDNSNSTSVRQQLMQLHATTNATGCIGPTDVSRWVITELDDTIPALISVEPTDLLKGNRNMRRAVSASALHRQATKSHKHLSSVHPFHETAPCVLSDMLLECDQQLPPQQQHQTQQRYDTTPCDLSDATRRRTQVYYPRDSVVNCVTSPPAAATSARKTLRQPKLTVSALDDADAAAARQQQLGASSSSVGTARRKDAPSSSACRPHAAVAAGVARTKSSQSLARHASSLSSHMVQSSASA